MFNLVFQLCSVFQIEVSLLFIKFHAPLYPFLCLLGKKPPNSAVFPSLNIFRMKRKAPTKRDFLSFPQFVQKKWKTKERSESTLVKTHEKEEADVEILCHDRAARMFERMLSFPSFSCSNAFLRFERAGHYDHEIA